LLIHSGLVAFGLGLIALGLDLVASASYTSGLINIPGKHHNKHHYLNEVSANKPSSDFINMGI